MAGRRTHSRRDGRATDGSRGRRDLASMVVPLGRDLMAAEAPVLAAHGLSVWGYIVLTALADGDAPTQVALAQSIGADKTRIIPILDDLQEQDLIERHADPADRRAYVLSLTAAGRRVQAAVQSEVQAGEERWLGRLSPQQRTAFLDALHLLAQPPA